MATQRRVARPIPLFYPKGVTVQNLAGVSMDQCSPVILQELLGAGIDVVFAENGVTPGEVRSPYVGLLSGALGDYNFVRAWYYWEASGRVPLSVGEEIYSDPIGKESVRAGGHAGRVPPRKVAAYFAEDGKQFAKSEEEEHLLVFEASDDPILRKIASEVRETFRFVEDPSSAGGEAYVSIYHIDSQEGLNLFVEALRRHQLIA